MERDRPRQLAQHRVAQQIPTLFPSHQIRSRSQQIPFHGENRSIRCCSCCGNVLSLVGSPEQMLRLPQKHHWKLEGRYRENIASSCNYTRVQSWVVSTQGFQGRIQGCNVFKTLFKSATALLVTVCGQEVGFCFTWRTWWHCLDTPPGVQQHDTRRHSHNHLLLVQKFSIQLQI